MKHRATFAQHDRALRRVLSDWGIENSRGIELLRTLMGAARLLEATADHNLRAAGLSMPRLRLLLWLRVEEECGNSEGVSPSRLSHFQHVSKNTVSALLTSLEAQGLIERALCREDKRSFKIRLTSAGRARVRAALPQHSAFLADTFSALTLKEQNALLKSVRKLNQALLHRITPAEGQPPQEA